MPSLPSTIALAGIAGQISASPHASNNTAIQTAVNSLIDALNDGAAGQVLTGVGSTLTFAYMGGVYRKATSKEVVSSVAETDLLNGEITIGAGVMGTTGAVRVTMLCDYLNNTGVNRNLTIQVKFGGTVLWGDLFTLGTGATRRPMLITFTIANQNSASVQFMNGFLAYTVVGNGSVGGIGQISGGMGGGPFASTGTSALDTSTSKTLIVTATHSTADASLSIRMQHATIEVV